MTATGMRPTTTTSTSTERSATMATIQAETAIARRNTRQRQLVREQLSGTDEFRTAQQLHAELVATSHAIGLATVYRTLQALVAEGEADAVRTPEGENSYRWCSREHHHHLICRGCGKAVEVQANNVESWTSQVAAAHGFRDAEHHVEIYGTCSTC